MVPKKILICTDFSENSRPAWELAVDYAKAFDAQLLLLHVIDFPNYVAWAGDWKGKLRDVLDATEDAAHERLNLMAKECAHLVKDVKTYCLTGIAPRQIVALAQEESVDLIVCGTHGRTGVTHLVMGSVARSVLKTAHRPMLIVEAPAEKGESFE
ncbi:MAG: universal stress protein [Desulfomonilaceae bacterium]